MVWTIPNILTFFRILAAPCVALAFVAFERPLADWVAFGLFVAAALTDFLDGWLARVLGQTSEIGKMLDPIADKVMVVIALALLMSLYQLNIWVVLPAVAMFARELLVSGLREHLGDVKLPVTRLAKWKTTLQLLAIGLMLAAAGIQAHLAADLQAGEPVGPEDIAQFVASTGRLTAVATATLWFAAILTVLTGIDYFGKGLVELRKREVKG